MTFAVLYKVSSADECAVKSIFQNLQSAAKGGSSFSQETLRLVQSRALDLACLGPTCLGAHSQETGRMESAQSPARARETPSVRSTIVRLLCPRTRISVKY